jgi:hypothetical protein
MICSFRKKVAKGLAKTAAVVRAAADAVKAGGDSATAPPHRCRPPLELAKTAAMGGPRKTR